VKFTVNEEGGIMNPKMLRTSRDSKADKLVLEAISKMPKWKPAQNSKGVKVKQEFTVPFGGGC
jgi:TonB family protein